MIGNHAFFYRWVTKAKEPAENTDEHEDDSSDEDSSEQHSEEEHSDEENSDEEEQDADLLHCRSSSVVGTVYFLRG